MTSEPAENVLHRKVSQGNRLRDASAVTPTRALRLALGRVADRLWGLPIVSKGIQSEVLDQETALSVVPDAHLILILRSGDGQVGLAVLDRALLCSLIEIQTVGMIFDRTPEERDYTSTDATIAWLYLDWLLGEVSDALGDLPEAVMWQGFRLETRAEDLRAAALALNAPQFAVFTAALELGEGQRRGEVRIFLPVRRKTPPARLRQDEPVANVGNGFTMLPTPVTVDLCTLRVPLTTVCRFKPGDLVDLPADALNMAVIRAAGGHVVAKGRLGQMNGFRAVRLNLPRGARKGQDSDQSALAGEDVGFTSVADQLSGMDSPQEEVSDLSLEPVSGGEEGDGVAAEMFATEQPMDLNSLADWEEE